jgi:predicted nucleic acid-binding protein
MMRQFVVDASVAVKWYLPEPLSDRAEAVLADAGTLLAPDCLYLEVASVLWQRVLRGEIDAPTAGQIVTELRKVPFELRHATELVSDALALAVESGCTLDDSLYLALALQAGCPVITADRPLYDILKDGPLGAHMLWLEDFV